jgi:exodeoxyribonuclease VII, small subunit
MKLKMKKSFESQIENLEKIVAELENGELSLDESVSKFEEGIKISKECNKTLEEAEKKITILINNDGETKEEEFKINE